MEIKERTPIIGLAVAVSSFLGFIFCGFACFTLHQALKVQRQDASETRTRLFALDQALKIQQRDLSQIREQLTAATHQIAEAQEQNKTLSRQITGIQSKPHENRIVAAMPFTPFQFADVQRAADVPAADSVEGKLRAEGKRWERTEGQPAPGGYVQDILPGRANQPNGRGDIGKVLSVSANDSGAPCAVVDFGHGFTTGIMFSELAPLRLVGPELR